MPNRRIGPTVALRSPAPKALLFRDGVAQLVSPPSRRRFAGRAGRVGRPEPLCCRGAGAAQPVTISSCALLSVVGSALASALASGCDASSRCSFANEWFSSARFPVDWDPGAAPSTSVAFLGSKKLISAARKDARRRLANRYEPVHAQHRREDADRASELSPATPADVVPPKPHGLVALRRCRRRMRPPQPHGGSGVQEQKSERQISRRRGAARLPARARAALSARDCAPLRIRGCSLSHPIARAGSRRFNLKGICADLEDMRRYRQTMAAWILCPRRRHGA